MAPNAQQPPFADATVTRRSSQRHGVRSPNATPTTARRNVLGEPGPCSGPFHAAQAHPAEAPQVKDACQAGLLGGGGVGFFASGLAKPWTDRAAALRGCPGSPSGAWVLPASRWPRSGAAAAPQAVPARGGRRADRRRQSPSRSCVRPPVGPPRHTNAHPICIQPPMCPMENPGLAQLAGYVCLCGWVCMAALTSRRQVRGVEGARVAISVRALLGGAEGSARTADATHCRSARKLVFLGSP